MGRFRLRPTYTTSASPGPPLYRLREKFPHFGPKKIKARLAINTPDLVGPAALMIASNLACESLTRTRSRHRAALGQGNIEAGSSEPNGEWAGIMISKAGSPGQPHDQVTRRFYLHRRGAGPRTGWRYRNRRRRTYRAVLRPRRWCDRPRTAFSPPCSATRAASQSGATEQNKTAIAPDMFPVQFVGYAASRSTCPTRGSSPGPGSDRRLSQS